MAVDVSMCAFHRKFNMQATRLLHFFVVPLVFLAAFLNAVVIGQEVKPTISVQGEAELQLPVDEIVIDALIVSRFRTPSEACKDNREKSRVLMEYLKTQIADEKSIKADYLSIDPVFPSTTSTKSGMKNSQNNNQDPFGASSDDDGASSSPLPEGRRAIGYVAYRKITIVLSDLKKFEDIYQGIVDKGVNRIDAVTYRSSQEKAQLEKLRLAAVRNARERGQSMAAELGAELSGIKSIANSKVASAGRGYGMGMGMGSDYGMSMRGDPFASDPTSNSEARVSLQASVDVVFYLGSSDFKK